jgi:hypothetical protein
MSTEPGHGQLWILFPWSLFAVAVGVKFWQINKTIRQRHMNSTASTERFRRTLERLWNKDHPSAR